MTETAKEEVAAEFRCEVSWDSAHDQAALATVSKLLSSRLFLATSAQDLARYNKALSRLGVSATALASFSIDALGWSPEVALEKKNKHYLSAGPANPRAIIISPAQVALPLVFPLISSQQQLLQQFFSQYLQEIANVTTTDALILDFDLCLSSFQSAADLLFIDNTTLRTCAGTLAVHAAEQRRLVARFEQPLGWFDPDLRAAIIASAEKHGDLRQRAPALLDLGLEVKNYYTRAFSGVFVFRHSFRKTAILVFDDPQLKSVVPGCSSFSINSKDLIHHLLDQQLLELDLDYYRKNPELLRQRQEALILDTLCKHYPELGVANANAMQRKRLLSDLAQQSLGTISEMQKVIKIVASGSILHRSELSTDLLALLVTPCDSLESDQQLIVEQLLCRLRPQTAPEYIEKDIGYFCRQFSHWPKAKRELMQQQLSLADDRSPNLTANLVSEL